MASPAVIEFHNQIMAQERARVALRIAQGTKASSPNLLSARWRKHDFKGLPDNSVGSKNLPFFLNPNQSDKVLEAKSLTGGVLRDYKYAKYILNRRARDTTALDMEKEGIEPPAQPLLELSDEESKSLELNNMLQTLQDAIETGDIADVSATIPELKNILRLFVSLIPTFTDQQLTEFMRFFQGMVEDLNAMLDDANPGRRQEPLVQTRNFIEKLWEFVKGFIPFANRSRADKDAKAKALLKEIFKLSPKGLGVRMALPVRVRPGAGGEEGGDEGDGGDEEETNTTVSSASRGASSRASTAGIAPEGEAEGAVEEAPAEGAPAPRGAPAGDVDAQIARSGELRRELWSALNRINDKEQLATIYRSTLERPRDTKYMKITEIRQGIKRKLDSYSSRAFIPIAEEIMAGLE